MSCMEVEVGRNFDKAFAIGSRLTENGRLRRLVEPAVENRALVRYDIS